MGNPHQTYAVIHQRHSAGRIVGQLDAGESSDALQQLLVEAPKQALARKLRLLYHAELMPTATDEEREAQATARLARLSAGKLKRYAFAFDTAAGPRIIKVSNADTPGNRLLGFLGSSPSAREHRLHAQAFAAGQAAVATLGYLEFRHGPWLLRSLQVQAPLDAHAISLGAFLARELATFGNAAVKPFAEALAQMHAVPFFHADLKGFHAFVTDVVRTAAGPATYKLRWIDLDRVAFWMSRRKRIINLYQALRFVVPDTADAQETFITAYCSASGWYAKDPGRALALVRHFLNHKRKTHPNP